MTDCAHTFQFQGVVYSAGSQLPGSSAYELVYEDRYFCSRCLETVDKNRRVQGNTYHHPISGSFPK